jgi:lipoprotein signal peptidase
MRKYQYWFFGFYALGVIGSVQNYKKQYGMDVFSPIGIFDNFVFNLLPAAIFTGIILLIHKTYLRMSGKNDRSQ